ncbi:MAG: M23 family metallopeptidase [Bacteroides sp.]|nr:M23 family metallopeptidase [Bacteroides sp.]
MAKEIYYKYNPETDNFERIYPSFRTRFAYWGKTCAIAFLMALVMFVVVFYCFDSPTEENLKAENAHLKSQYSILKRRLDNSLKVMDRLQDRDDNFYRVMMQMEPMSATQRLVGLDNESRYRELKDMSDAGLVTELTRRMDLFERRMFAQSQSYDQLRQTFGTQKDKLAHIPSIIPVDRHSYSLASGYGYRRDPVNGISKYHEGIDFTVFTGSPVYATGDGKVEVAHREAGYGNCIDINHGYNYLSRYAHLSEILVKEGDEVKRGQIIGRVGSTGRSKGPHLHYEVRFKGETQNPVNYCFMDLSPEQYADMIQMAENAGHVMD